MAERGRQWCENALLALLYFSFLTTHLQQLRWSPIAPILVQETLLALLFLIRRPSVDTTISPLDWIAGVVGTFAPLLIRAGGGGWVAVGISMQMIGVTISSCALLSLGRSLGIVAANRGVKAGGLYAIVRHPMYVGHLLTLTGYLLAFPTLRNAVIVGTTLAAMMKRMEAEERLLSSDHDYLYYAAHVRFRLVPGVY